MYVKGTCMSNSEEHRTLKDDHSYTIMPPRCLGPHVQTDCGHFCKDASEATPPAHIQDQIHYVTDFNLRRIAQSMRHRHGGWVPNRQTTNAK